MTKCFENFVSQTLGFLASFFAAELRDKSDTPDIKNLMEKLDKAYEGLELLKSIGMNGSQEQLRQIKEMEKEYLESEVVPLLKQEFEPLVEKLMNKFSLTIKLEPDKEMSITLDENGQAGNQNDLPQISRNVLGRSTSIGFSVHFDDGVVIKHADAKKTFVEALRKMGLDNVSRFKERTFKGYSLVDRQERKDCDFTCQEQVDGWYVYVTMSNDKKMELLMKVAKMLDVNLRIVKDDGSEYSEPQMTIANKSSREYFSLNGSEPYNKRRFVLEAVKLFMRNNPTATFYDITEAFPDRLQGSYGVAKKLDWVLEKERNGLDFRVRYSMNNDEILTSYDGIRFVVSNQWGIQFYRFAEWVKNNMGWEVERV